MERIADSTTAKPPIIHVAKKLPPLLSFNHHHIVSEPPFAPKNAMRSSKTSRESNIIRPGIIVVICTLCYVHGRWMDPMIKIMCRKPQHRLMKTIQRLFRPSPDYFGWISSVINASTSRAVPYPLGIVVAPCNAPISKSYVLGELITPSLSLLRRHKQVFTHGSDLW